LFFISVGFMIPPPLPSLPHSLTLLFSLLHRGQLAAPSQPYYQGLRLSLPLSPMTKSGRSFFFPHGFMSSVPINITKRLLPHSLPSGPLIRNLRTRCCFPPSLASLDGLTCASQIVVETVAPRTIFYPPSFPFSRRSFSTDEVCCLFAFYSQTCSVAQILPPHCNPSFRVSAQPLSFFFHLLPSSKFLSSSSSPPPFTARAERSLTTFFTFECSDFPSGIFCSSPADNRTFFLHRAPRHID